MRDVVVCQAFSSIISVSDDMQIKKAYIVYYGTELDFKLKYVYASQRTT
jgi:hypothetical protein